MEIKEEITGIMNQVYDDNWCFSSYGGMDIILIKFDKFNITNSNRDTHEIRDLYVWVEINLATGKLENPELFGARGYYTALEAVAKYSHSHLSASAAGEYGLFCLGYTEIRVMLQQAYQKYNTTEFTLLMYSIGNYVKWESLEGGPYQRMTSIAGALRNNSTRLPHPHSSEIYEMERAIVASDYRPQLSFNDTNCSFTVEQNDQFIAKLLELGATSYKYDTVLGEYLKIDNIQNRVRDAASYIQNRRTSLPRYKGESIKPIVDMETAPKVADDVELNDTIILRPHHYLIDSVAARLGSTITMNYRYKLLEDTECKK